MPKIKLDDNGAATINGEKITMVGDDGKEFEFDVSAAHVTISELRNEAGTWRKKLRTAEASLEAFEGIEDPQAAKKALQDVKTMGDDNKAALDALRTEMSGAYESKIQKKDDEIQGLVDQLFKLEVTDKFHTSEVAATTIYPPDDAALIFGRNFVREDGALVGKLDGKIIYSKEKPGEPAGFDEALQAMIDAKPNRDSILKSNAKGGSGSQPGGQGGAPPTGEKSPTEQINAGLAERGWT